ncbi:lipoprotein insertase outer membrane protein LolB [Acidovorax sp.]|uniref:lipoprotein insertase outer membrane protein LolB n=1 Tax=Acidovorax sp. TaxID=1872122 RepID=UPI0025BB65DE|nr:lipoprotein insertase outer membrane protein LolB [Acidovorax sp.]
MRLAFVALIAMLSLVVSGCASRAPAVGTGADFWSGRLALQVEGRDAQSFSALFELRGDDQRGELVLLSPLGNRLAQLTWTDGQAELVSSEGRRSSSSLDALVQDVAGTSVPIAALFEWLRGHPMAVPGWEADLSASAQGRVVARRHSPPPAASLRIALTR